MLPNALIVAFTDGANFRPNGDGRSGELTVDIRDQQVGLLIDSAVFLYLAFGSLAYIEGQIIGKLLMVLLAIPLVKIYRDKYSAAVFS